MIVILNFLSLTVFMLNILLVECVICFDKDGDI